MPLVHSLKLFQSVVDLHSVSDCSSTDGGSGQTQNIKDALLKEVKVFHQRERLIYDFKVTVFNMFK